MDKTRKWRKILAMMLTVVMMLQNVQSVIVSAGVTTEEIEARLNGQTQQTQEQQPSESQVETRANGETYQTQQQTQQQEEQQESQQDQQTAGGSSGDASETGISDGSQNAGNNADAQNDTTKISNANVSATITQSIFQEEISGGTYNFAQMTAKITNNDTENAATGVQVTALLPSQLSYINEYGKETSGILAYAAPYQAQASGCDLSAIPSETLDTYANSQIALWVNQTIGAGETAEYNFAVQIQDGITDVSGMDTVWYVNGTKCNYSWENAELLTPAQTPEVTEEPEVTETPEETPAPEVTETPEETPAPEVTEAPEETPAPEVTETPEETPAPEVTEAPEETPTPEVTEAPEKTPTPTISEDKKTKLEEQDKLLSQSKDRLNIKKSSKKAAKMGEKNSEVATYEGEGDSSDSEGSNSDITDKSNIMCNGNKVDVSLKINGTQVDTSKDITLGRNDNISLSIAYQYSEDNKPKARENNEGQLDNVRYYDLPAQGWTYSNTNGYIKNGNDNVGTYEIINDNGKMRVKLTYYESFLKAYPKNIKGTFTLRMQVDKAYVAGSDEINFDFPGLTKRVTLNPSGLTGSKEYNYDKDDPDKKPILNADGTLTYYIKLQPDTANVKNIEITDRLTGQFDYVDNSFELIKFEGNNEISRSDINGNTTINHQDKTAKVNISELEYGENTYYKLKYDVKPEDGIRDFKASNSASWTWGENGKGTGSGSGSAPNIDLTNETLKKSGVVDNENIITYTVEINKIGALLLPEGVTNGKLVLTDKIPNNVTWLGDVTITGGTTQGWSYDDKTRMLTVTVDDGTPVTLVYKVRVNGAEGDTVSSVENTINLKGTSISSKEENKNIYIQDASATARGDNGTFTIVKRGLYSVEVNTDEGKKIEQPKLEGAEFELHQIVLENGSLKDKLVDTKTSDGRGRITFGDAENVDNQIQKDTLYYYMETKAPTATAPDGSERYIKDSTKNYFIYRENGLSADLESAVSRAGITYKVFEDGTILDPVTNDTEPTPKSISFEATKNLDGETATVPFKFNLMLSSYRPSSSGYVTSTYAPGDRNAAPVSISDVADALNIENDNVTGGYNQTVEAKGKIVFPKVNFKYEGTYTFVMRELAENGDYVYDKSTKNITVIVERDSDGKLMVTPSSDVKNITFNNSTAVRLKIKKVINIADTENRTFGFTIECSDKTFTFDGVRLNGNQVSINKGVAEVEITVPAGEKEATIELTGIPKDKVLTVKEKTNNMPSGWSYTSTDPENGQVTMDTTKTVTITNEYKETGGITFKVNKSYNDWGNGRSFDFKLTGLSAVDEKNNSIAQIPMPSNNKITINDESNGDGDTKTGSFGNVEYTKNGTYYYMIEEVIPDKAMKEQGKNPVYNGVTYDNKVTYFKIEVKDGKKGKKAISVFSSGKVGRTDSYETTLGYTGIQGSQTTAAADFTNEYKAATSITFKATKSLENQSLGNRKFDFYIKGTGETNYPEKTVQNVGGNITFESISYNQDDLKGVSSKEFSYEIGEKPTSANSSITYDQSKYTVKVKVSNDGKGNLSIAEVTVNNGTYEKDENSNVYTIKPSDNNKAATFVNVYEASANVIFTATKNLSGRSLNDGEFSFILTGDDGTRISATNTGNKITFKGDSNSGITYTMDDLKDATETDNDGHKYKIFYYTIKEDLSGITPTTDDVYKKNGVTYDLTTYYVQVKVTDTGTGSLDLEVSTTDKDRNVQNSVAISATDRECAIPYANSKKANFENTYDASTSIKFVGNKKLENKALAAGQFKFTIKGSNVPGNTGSEEVSNDENGNFESSTISYSLKDLNKNGTDYTNSIFNYEISEVDGKQPGINYDTTKYNVSVTVTNDTTTGQLVPTAKAGTTDLVRTQDKTGTWIFTLPKQNSEATFINTYGAQAEVQLAATKELKNKTLEADKYSFSITQTNDDSGFASDNPGTILVAGTLGTEAVVKNGAETGSDPKDIKFPVLQYKITDLKKSGGTYADSRTFHYTISEKAGKEGGVTYSNQHYYVDVKVTDNGDGTFTTEVRVSTDSKTSFDKKQVITPNNDVYSLTSSNNYSFTNIYEASTKVQLTGIKKLVNNDKDKTGRKLKDVSYGTKSFSFEITGPNLKDENGKDVKSRTVEIQTTDKDTDTAVFAFPEITYDVTDLGGKNSEEFKYTIIEKAPQDSKDTKGITYDNSEYTAIVTVTDNKDGTLSSSVKLQKNGAEESKVDGNEKNGVAVYALTGSEPTFTNRYDASGSYEFKVNKTLAGRKFQEGDNFNFQIVKTDGNKEEVIGTLSLKADGNLPAEKLTGILAKEEYGLSDVGKTYKYSIQELNPENKMNGVTVSDQRYIIYVKVTDNNDGTLKSEAEWRREVNGKIETITFDEEHEAVIDFQNVYEADGTAQIVAQKTLSPLKLEDNNSQFSFVLTRVDADGKELTDEDAYTETVSNKGSAIVFTPITYNQNDVGKDFYYTVKEIAGKDKGYAYSKDVYNVHVTVSIDKQDNHKLITTKEITDATGATQDAIVFANTYEATASVTLEGKKEIVDSTGKAIENATLEDGKFTFTVKDENGTIVSTGKNDTDGKITFTPIEYKYSKESNPLGEHIYTVTEDQPEAGDQYIYDHNSRTVVVNVADNGDGTLTASVVTDPDKSDAISGEKCFRNEVISLKFRKTDLTKADTDADKTLAGATLKLSEYDTVNKKAGTEIAQWTTTNEDYTVNGLIAGTTYILEEIAAPEGYTTADPIIFTIKNDEKRSVEVLSESGQLDETGKTVIMSDAKTGVTVLKVDNDGKGVSGAKLAILDGETVKAEWTSDGQPKYIEGLIVGKEYVLRELSAPAGYRKAEDVKFTVEDGKTTSVKMVDVQTTVSILKVDEKGNALSGAILEVRDKASNTLIDRWETDGKAHTISGLTEGETYILSEISAPDGYTLAKPQEFTLDTTKPVTEIKMENKQNSVTISKKALTGTDSIAGAVLRVLDATGKEVVPKWTTEAGKDKVVTGVLKPNVTYTLEEVSAPSGYAKADNITFAVDEDGVLYVNHEKATSVVMRDAQLRLCVSKTDITGKAELPGAVLQIIEKDTKTVVDEWTTTTTPHYTDKGLVSGKTYLLHEKTAPAGYAYAEDVEFTLRNDSVVGSEQKVTMYDAPNTVVITKTDLTGKELAGAKLQILDANGKVLESWTSSTEEHRVEASLEAGKEYILREVEAPEGYVLAEDVKFTVNKDGSTTRVAMKDAPTGVNISKTDLTGSKEIAGAVLQVLDKNGATVEQWTSDGTTHTVESKLVAGETYILHEVSAPAGYRTAKDIEFTVDKTGKTTKVVMKDAPTQASILKTDQNGKGLAGATLAVKDSTGKVLEQWTSDGSAHVIEGLLTVGQTYTLSEISAPAGYTVAPDQTFTMEDKDVIEVTMVDTQETTGSGQITVTKKVSLVKGGDIIDMIANDDTFYVNIFTDAAGKYPYKGAKPQAIHLVNASAGSVTFDGLGTGTYYVYETDADGNVISLDTDSTHNGVQFMCTVDGGTNSVALDLKAGAKEGVVNLDNMFYDIPDGYSYKANISINKQVLKGTDQTTVDDTFYAGIFTKDDDGVYNLFRVVELVQNDTVTVEVPLGGDDGTQPINYYVLETDADGNILDLDVFEYEVSGEGTVALSVDNTTGNINLVNKVPEEKNGKLRVQKVDENGVGLAGASFRLTNAAGEVVEEWTSEASAHELELEPGTYTLTEVQAPDGYTGEGSLTITVDEDYNFTVDGQIEYSYKDDLIKVVNKSVAPTPTPEVTPGVTPGPNGGTTTTTSSGGGSTPVSYSTLSGKVAVKTGDNTPIGAYVLILVVAAAAIVGGVVYKKKRRKDK